MDIHKHCTYFSAISDPQRWNVRRHRKKGIQFDLCFRQIGHNFMKIWYVHYVTKSTSWWDSGCNRGHRKTSARTFHIICSSLHVDQSNINGDKAENIHSGSKVVTCAKPWCSTSNQLCTSPSAPKMKILPQIVLVLSLWHEASAVAYMAAYPAAAALMIPFWDKI